MKCILGKKIEMTQVYDKEGNVIPVTLIGTDVCNVLQVKTKEKDGYSAIKLGFDKLKDKKVKKTKTPFRYVKEFKLEEGEMKVGDTIEPSVFVEGDKVKVSGISKGKGFQGGMKRWGFAGKEASHGVKHEQRTIGSIGCSVPGRVIKGRRMPGRMGSDRISVRGLEIIKVDNVNKIIAVKGAVPGRRGTLLEIRGL
ncbi:MAG TPA: 50S ribosomal protein L3 [Candidatus Pacearchaeota archaeon]|nr:50S ribosomal protein L3 [Candidatus Parcubacteria bacterium]HNP79424.1 50S ribosomal protein L3 [Candidatus Pacearchaeota archaeon]HOC53599.1 50S ribosomal protein L3 [Candidatus Pacearchaeota archaeon]HQM24659.1 50S ribosomal protein L3 [Candidatus Pacearchaeota archaeon]